jgi:basic membrane lipoprotein Med (substrate-binding protein (PBP1-ABC) superfamily)
VKRTFWAWAVVVMAALALGLAACGDDDDDDGGGGGGGEAQGEAIKAGVVTDIGGLDDRSFNFLANKGLEQAQSELGTETRVLLSDSNADYVPNLTQLAQQQFDLIVPVGFLMADATNTVASKVPNANFAMVDFSATALKDKPKNVQGLLFRENEAGYLAGYLSRRWTTTSPVTRPAPRPRIRVSRRLTATRRISSTRPSARRSLSTRSPRARRSCSRWRAGAV